MENVTTFRTTLSLENVTTDNWTVEIRMRNFE